MADAAASFLAHRPALVGLAYRMTGSLATAEDIAQEVYLRWEGAGRAAISLPRAWLMKTAARLALDHLKSAQFRREAYVGPWLPEPVLEEAAAPQEEEWARAENIALAFLLTLQRLSPAERVARKKSAAPAILYQGRINAAPGFVTQEPAGLPQATVLEIADGQIRAVYIVRNPEKLRAITASLGL